MSGAAEGAAAIATKGAATCCSCLWTGLKRCCSVFSDCVKRLSATTVSILLRVINIVNAILLGACCFFSFEASNGSPTRFFLTTYIGLFALLLFLFETRVPWSAPFIRRMFGFMFSYTGRAVFLVFVGCICFGMIDSSLQQYSAYTWCYVMGFVTIINAAFNAFILCSHPGFRNGSAAAAGTAGASPTDPAQMTPEQLQAYLKAHPEIAAAAAAAAAGGAGAATAVAVGTAETHPQGHANETPAWARGRAGGDNDAAPLKTSGGGFGALFSGWGSGAGTTGKAKPASAAAAVIPVDDGGYKPPVVATAPSVAAAPAPFDAGDNPFGSAGPARAAAPPAPAAAAPPTAPPRPVIGDDDDDNPFATPGV